MQSSWLVGFSIVASILTLVGVYGVLSLSVASRRREIAVCSAIGAQGRDTRRLLFTDAFRLIAGGVVAGIVAAIVLSRALTTFLFEVESTDPPTLVGVGFPLPSSRFWRAGCQPIARHRSTRWRRCGASRS